MKLYMAAHRTVPDLAYHCFRVSEMILTGNSLAKLGAYLKGTSVVQQTMHKLSSSVGSSLYRSDQKGTCSLLPKR